MRIYLLLFTILLTVHSMDAISQDETSPHFEVNINHPPLSISYDQLIEANTLADLNRMFKPEWVREYISVKISTVQDGKIVSIDGEDNTLSRKQKNFLKRIDFPAPITVSIQYMPENTLKYNPARNESFTFSVHPTSSAVYSEGAEKLEEFLKERVVDHIPSSLFHGYKLAVVKFTINELGQVVDTHIFEGTKDDAIDTLLYNTVCDMPKWIPAQHSNGKKVRQEFALTIGNHESCTINLLNTVNNKY